VHPLLGAGYAAAGALARLAAALAPATEGKLARTLRARRGLRDRWQAWAATHRDPARALLWMHAPSVGEGLQARPVLELARAKRPDLQLAYTHFSPSAERFARGLGVDFAEYLPFDTRADMDAALDLLTPRALVFSKLDVWPVLVARARVRRVRLGMISATLAAGSSRGHGLARALLRDAHAALDAVGAIDADDAERLVTLGVRPDVITVTGDTRSDQVWARARAADRGSALLAPLASDRPTLVAGSTWPADEVPLLDAWKVVRARVPDARLIIAPHEPTPTHLAPVEDVARAAGLRFARFGSDAQGDADVVIVDRVGVLGDLYALADAAYVGGGFHAAGLHSVLEPAAFGAPVLFGPRHHGSRDAGLLLASGGGAVGATAGVLEEALAQWLGDAAAGRRAGDAARGVVERGLGAAERSWKLVERLLDG
jgi:3-deoxy-D-manno-octulosonic-acid transferase